MTNIKNRKSEISSIVVPKGSKEFLEIKSLAVSNDFALKEIEKVISYVQEEHKKILNDVKQRRELKVANLDVQIYNIQNKAIPLLENKINFQEKTLVEFNNQIERISKNLKNIELSNPSLSALKLMEKRDLTAFIIDLNTKIMDMKDKKEMLSTVEIDKLKEKKLLLSSLMMPHNYKNTQIIGEIIINDDPIKPKKILILIVSFIIGLILSIFLVFILEFIRSENKNKNKSESK